MGIWTDVKNGFKIFFFSLTFLISSNAFAQTQHGEGDTYAQLSSMTTQIPGVKKKSVVFENIDDIQGLTLANHNKIIVNTPGLYFVMATGQAGAQDLGISGYVCLNLEKNGKSIPHSITSQYVSGKDSVSSLVSQAVLNLKQGDKISVGIVSKAPSLGLIATDLSDNSIIPSVIFTMYKINSKNDN